MTVNGNSSYVIREIEDMLRKDQDRLSDVEKTLVVLRHYHETARQVNLTRIGHYEGMTRHNDDNIRRAQDLAHPALEADEDAVAQEYHIAEAELDESNIGLKQEIFILKDEADSKLLQLDSAIAERNMLIATIAMHKEKLAELKPKESKKKEYLLD